MHLAWVRSLRLFRLLVPVPSLLRQAQGGGGDQGERPATNAGQQFSVELARQTTTRGVESRRCGGGVVVIGAAETRRIFE